MLQEHVDRHLLVTSPTSGDTPTRPTSGDRANSPHQSHVRRYRQLSPPVPRQERTPTLETTSGLEVRSGDQVWRFGRTQPPTHRRQRRNQGPDTLESEENQGKMSDRSASEPQRKLDADSAEQVRRRIGGCVRRKIGGCLPESTRTRRAFPESALIAPAPPRKPRVRFGSSHPNPEPIPMVCKQRFQHRLSA